MGNVSVQNTSAATTGKTLVLLESTQIITGQKTFDLGASAPFVVPAGAAKVTHLDADLLDGLESTAFAILASAAAFLSTVSVAGTISPLGLVDVSGAAAGQVKFPATQNPSTNANTLDDYEEGSWTPSIGGSGGQSGQAYTTQVGTYTKIGKQVTASFNIVLSTLGVVTTDLQVQGLPFTSQNTSNAIWSLVIGKWANTTTAIIWMGGVLAANATVITIHRSTAATTGPGVTAQADFANNTQLVGSITYMASA